MIRFAFRQFRTQALVALVGLVALAILIGVTGTSLLHLYDTTVVGCQRKHSCELAQQQLTTRYVGLGTLLNSLVLILPAVLGIFWGAPLIARELESGTFRLAWTQSVTRSRWLAVKLGVVGLAALVTTGLTSLMVTWWSSPLDAVSGSPYSTFDKRDLVLVAYALFAVALGTAFGLVFRKVLPAMGATLATFIGVRLAIVEWVRPHLAPPLTLTSPLAVSLGGGLETGGALPPGAWVVNEQTVNAAGKAAGTNGVLGPNGLFGVTVTPNGGVALAPGHRCNPTGRGVTPQAMANAVRQCVDRLHLHQIITYQPSSRYWPFQWEESAIYVVLALLLVGFCFWWMRRTYSGGRTFFGHRGVTRPPESPSDPTPLRAGHDPSRVANREPAQEKLLLPADSRASVVVALEPFRHR